MPDDSRAPVRTAMILRAPGWYPDPDGAADRWWNGSAWTDGVRTAGDPDAVATGADSAYASAHSAEQVLAKAKSELTWAPLGLGVLAVIGVALVPVLHVIGVAFLTLAAAAVLTGVRALALRAKGVAIPVAPAVAGILLGSISAVLLALALVGWALVRLL